MFLTENALQILSERYLLPGESPEDRFLAISQHLAEAETSNKQYWAQSFFEGFNNRYFIVNSPVLANYGVPFREPQGSACFVLDIEDDLIKIGETKTKAMLIQRSGGGTGINFSPLRPRGALVKSTGRPTSGVIPFITSFNYDLLAISQGGLRNGAAMAVLNCDHPDLVDFIQAKNNECELTAFNLSVGITDSFMDAVHNDQDWELSWTNQSGYKEISRIYKAREIFSLLVEKAHHNGEPGVIFLDRLKETNPIPENQLDCTNPCGEQPLSPWESCVLGHLNLATHIKTSGEIDWERLKLNTHLLVRVLDNIVTLNQYPLEIIKHTHNQTRKIGLGITGLADFLILLGLPYHSPEGRETAENLMRFISSEAFKASIDLGIKKGSFPLFTRSIYYGKVPALRNAARTSIAPTGTTSTLLGTEGFGMEPLIALSYQRNILDGKALSHFSQLLITLGEKEGWLTSDMLNITKETGSLKNTNAPRRAKELFKTASEISPSDHLKMLTALQPWIDAGISKTVLLPEDFPLNKTYDLFLEAYQNKIIKGLTVFRQGSRANAPIQTNKSSSKGIVCVGCD